MAEDAKALIELATRRFLEEVPALEPIKLVVGSSCAGGATCSSSAWRCPA